MSSYRLMFPGVRSSLVFSGFGLKPPGFQSYSYSSLKTSPSVTSKAVPSVCFSFFCLLASSVSNFHPDTRGWWWTLFKAHLFSRAVGREEHCKQITLACACSVLATLGLPSLTSCVLSLSTLLRLYLGCSARNCLRLALGCMHFPGLSRSGSGTRVVLRGANPARPAFCALPRSEQLRPRCLASAVAVTCHLPRPCRSVFWVYNWRTFTGRC